jgi:hypothetical protein
MGHFSSDKMTAWSQYHRAIQDLLGDAQPEIVVQPLAVAARAEWDTDKPLYNLYLRQRFANAMPTWTPLYNDSQAALHEQYRAFLRKASQKIISTGQVPNESLLKSLMEEVDKTGERLQKLEEEIRKEWEKYAKTVPLEVRETRDEWEQQNGYSGRRAVLQEKADTALGRYFQEMSKVGPRFAAVGEAVAALGARSARMALPDSYDLADPQFRDSWETYYRATIVGNIETFKLETNTLSMTVKDTSAQSSEFVSRWNVSGGASYGFFAFGRASVSSETVQRNWENDTTEIGISFKNVGLFPVEYGQWFRGGLVNEFLRDLDEKDWGPDGYLNLIPTAVLLGRGLKLNIKTSEQAGSSFNSWRQTNASAGFRIGPFGFGGSGGQTTSHSNTQVTGTNTDLTIEDTSGRAYAIAVLSRRPLDLLRAAPGGTPVVKRDRADEDPAELAAALRSLYVLYEGEARKEYARGIGVEEERLSELVPVRKLSATNGAGSNGDTRRALAGRGNGAASEPPAPGGEKAATSSVKIY